MAKVIQNFSDDVLELIGTGQEFRTFDLNLGHYVRVTIRESSRVRGVYSSHRTWDNQPVYYDNHIAYNAITNQPLEDPYNEIQAPIYYDLVDENGFPTEESQLYVKPNDIMEMDKNYNYTNGKYEIEFDFLDNVFNHFVDSGLDYVCNIDGFCSSGEYQTQNECESYGFCTTGNGTCSYNTAALNGNNFGIESDCIQFGTCESILGTCLVNGTLQTEEFVNNEETCMNYNTGMHGFCYDSQGQLLNSYFTEEECCGADGSFCADGGTYQYSFYLLTTSWTADSYNEDVTEQACSVNYECAADGGDASSYNGECNSENVGQSCALEYFCDGDEAFNVDCSSENISEGCGESGATCSSRGLIDGNSGFCIENSGGNNWIPYTWTAEQIDNVLNANCQGPSPNWTSYVWTPPYESNIYYSTEDYGESDALTTCNDHCILQPNGGDCQEIVNDIPFQLKYLNPKFYVKEVSATGNEARLLAVHDYWDGESYDDMGLPIVNYAQELKFSDDNFYFLNNFLNKFGNPNPPSGESPTYKADLNLYYDGRQNVTITNFVFDKVSFDTTSLIVRLQYSVSLPQLANVELVKEIYPTQTQEITFFADVFEEELPSYLVPSEDTWITDQSVVDTGQSYNDLIESASLTYIHKNDLLTNVFSESYTDDLTTDFSKLEKATFFGSHEYKIRNFFNKVKKIEDYVNIISSSINVTSSIVNETKKHNFNLIREEVSNFTPYEKWLYTNNESTSSYPKAGVDYSKLPAVTGSFTDNYKTIEGNASLLKNQEGLDLIYKIESHGDDVIVSGSYTNIDSSSKAWYTGSSSEPFWKHTGTKLAYDSDHGTGVQYVYQIDDNNVSLTQPNLAQFELDKSDPDNPRSNTYIVEFDVSDLHRAGRLTFELGRNEAENTANLLDFDSSLPTGEITENKHYKALTSVEFEPDLNTNYLRIFGGIDSITQNHFSGSIDNLEIRLAKDRDGKSDIFTDKYFTDDYSMGNYNGEFYLSFLARWQSLPVWENTNISASNTLRPIIPQTAFNNRYIESPPPTTESFQRYILAASQSFWRPVGIDGQAGLNESQATDSTYWEIQSGSSQYSSGSKLEGFDDLTPYLAYGDGTILPTGELFRLYHITSSEQFAPVTSSFITDVRVFKQDEIYNKAYSTTTSNISDVIWFTNLYSTSSQLVQDWYSSSLAKAIEYDKNNVHTLTNNIPRHFIDEDTSNNLKLFLSLLAENYDSIKYYIDNYSNFNSKDYSDVEGIPNNVIELIGDNYGWNFLNPNQLQNLLQYYVGEETANISYKDLTYKIWKNILNNLNYIYKSKGTEKSIRALINAFGLPPDVITVNDTGISSEQQVQSSPGIIPLTTAQGIRNYPGNISFQEKNTIHQFFNWSSNMAGNKPRALQSDWNTSKTGLSQAVEFIFSSKSGSSTEYLIRSKASSSAALNHSEMSDLKDLWSLNLVPSQSSTVSASLMLQINSSNTGSGLITGSAISMSTDFFPIRYKPEEDVKYWNVLVQRAETGSKHIYEIHLANRVDDTIKYYWTGSMTASNSDYMSPTLSGSYVRENFVGTGSVPPTSGSNLIIGPWHGGLGEFRVWKEPITGSDFLMHTFNWNSVVNRKSTDDLYGFEKLTYRYNFKGDYKNKDITPVIQDVVNNDKGSFSILAPTVRWKNSRISFVKKKTTDFIFNARNISNNNQINTKKSLIVDETKNLKPGGLSSNESNLINIGFEDDYKSKQRFSKKVVNINISANTRINELFNNYLSDIDGGALLAKSNEYDEQYQDLKDLKTKIVNLQTKEFTDINKYYSKVNKLIPPTFWQILSDNLPVGTDIQKSFVYENTILDRNKTPLERDPELISDGDKWLGGVNIYNFEDNIVLNDEIGFTGEIKKPKISFIKLYSDEPDTGGYLDDIASDITISSQFHVDYDTTIEDFGDLIKDSSEFLNYYDFELEIHKDFIKKDAIFNQIYEFEIDMKPSMEASKAISFLDTELTLGDFIDVKSKKENVLSTTLEDFQKDFTKSNFISQYISNVLSKTDEIFIGTKSSFIINLIPATVRITDELQLETQGNIVTPYISQQLFLSDDIIPINGITSNPIDTLENIVLSSLVNLDDSILKKTLSSTLETLSENLNFEKSSYELTSVIKASTIVKSSIYNLISTINNTNYLVNNSIELNSNLSLSGNSGNNYITLDSISKSPDVSAKSQDSIEPDSIIMSIVQGLEGDMNNDYDAESINLSATFAKTTGSFESVFVPDEGLETYAAAYNTSGQFQQQPKGSTGDINESINDVFGGVNFDFSNYLDRNNDTNKILRAISMTNGSELSGSNSLGGEDISYTIGDTEKVWTRERTKRKMTVKYEGGVTIDNIEDFVEREFDITNPNNFSHQQVKLDGTKIGRTTQIRTFDFWDGGAGFWDETDFTWDDAFGDIFYPLNHYIYTANTDFVNHLDKGTLNDGSDPNQTDPIDRTPDENKKGAIWVTTVDDGKSGTRIKVVKDN